MRFSFSKLLSVCSVAFLLTPSVQAIEVLSTVKPIHLIVNDLTDGVAESDYLLPSGTSPHDYALRPSDVKKVKNADVLIWFGPDLERFLESFTRDKENVVTISRSKTVQFREFGEQHDHHGHDHGNVDAHFWLGPVHAIAVARDITAALSQYDKLNSGKYQANLERFEASVSSVSAELSTELAPYQGKGYFVFHDAYGYFEETFNLNNLGSFTVSPDRKPGAKTLINIRKSLQANNAECVFSEPQFQPAVIESVTRNTSVKRGELDPLASDIDVQLGSYSLFLKGLGDEFIRCLSK